MTPEQLAKPGTEHSHQVALFCWASQQFEKWPELKWLFAIPNGGQRNIIVAASLKAEGVKSGVSDICLPVARSTFHGLYIEMKKPGGKESPQQIRFGEFLTAQGYLYKCCDHWDLARDTIVNYLKEQNEPTND